MSCDEVDFATRVALLERSQYICTSKASIDVSVAPGATLGSETLSDIRQEALGNRTGYNVGFVVSDIAARAKKRTRQSSLFRPGTIDVMSNAEGERIIRAEVEGMVSRGDSLDRFQNPFVKAALVLRHPALHKMIPVCSSTVFEK